MSTTNPAFISGIPMVSVPLPDGGVKLVSQTPVTNGQYAPPVQRHLDEGARYAQLVRGLNGRIAVVLWNEGTARDTVGVDLVQRADSNRVVTFSGNSLFLCKLVARPSPEGFGDPEQPVVNISPVDTEVWCELSGGELRLLSKKEMIHLLTEGGTRRFPTSTGELFDGDRRLVHGRLKMMGGRILRAVQGDPEFTVATCAVNATGPDGQLIYPDGPFGTRWAQAGVILIGAGDLFFGGSWYGGGPGYFAGSFCVQLGPDYRSDVAGFGVGRSA